ncbi:MAG TPA: PAS domain S-box protein, partial [Usitatibacter sp.]
MVIYLPVYYNVGSPKSVEERREMLRGFVNVVMRVDDVLADMLSPPILARLRMRIDDVGPAGSAARASDETIFYQSAAGARDPQPGLLQVQRSVERPLVVAGRQWRLLFEDEPTINPWLRPFPLLALVGGLAMSFLLFGILYAIGRGRSDAVALASNATRELRSQLSFTQQLIEAMPNPVFFKDREGRYLGCNRAFEEFIGKAREEIIGRTVGDIAAADIVQRSATGDAALVSTPGSQSYEASVVYAKDGLPHDVIVSKATLVDPSGEVAGLIGVLVDITERKKLEGDTRASHERLRAVIQAAPVAIFDCDSSNIVRMWNPAAELMFGWDEAQVLGKPLPV